MADEVALASDSYGEVEVWLAVAKRWLRWTNRMKRMITVWAFTPLVFFALLALDIVAGLRTLSPTLTDVSFVLTLLVVVVSVLGGYSISAWVRDQKPVLDVIIFRFQKDGEPYYQVPDRQRLLIVGAWCGMVAALVISASYWRLPNG